jgi:hypothetical protein
MKMGLILRDDNLRLWQWPHTQETICVIPDGTKADDALVKYLVDNRIKGTATYHHLNQLVHNLKKKEEEAKVPPPPAVFERPEAETVSQVIPEKPKPGRPVGTKGIKKTKKAEV